DDPEENPWGISFLRMLDMANDSSLFRTQEDLTHEGWSLQGNVFIRGAERMLPLYEAKMVHHYDHRFATFDGLDQRPSPGRWLPRLTVDDHDDPRHSVLPWYWVAEAEVKTRIMPRGWGKDWLIGWRRNARSVDERTMIPCVLPRYGVGDSIFLLL